MDERKKVLFNTDWYEILKLLDERVKYEVYDSLMKYAHTGVVTEGLSSTARMAFTFIKGELDANIEEQRAQEEKAERRSEMARAAINARWRKVNEKPVKKDPKAVPKVMPKPKKKDPEKIQYAEFVSLSEAEFNKLCEAHGEMAAKRMIEILDNYKGSKGAKYKSDYRAILNWVVNRFNEENERHGNQRTTTTGSAKQDVNNYAMQQYLDDRKRAEEGIHAEVPKPF